MIWLARVTAGLGILLSGMLAALHPPHTPLPAAEPVMSGPAPVESAGAVEQLVARQPHKLEIPGSSPGGATGGGAPANTVSEAGGSGVWQPAHGGSKPVDSPIPSQQVVSTAYCPAQGPTMVDGSPVHEGAVAMGTIRNPWPPIGTRMRVLSGSRAGAVLTVQDRYGAGTQFDIFLWDCWAARRYGRQTILVAPA